MATFSYTGASQTWTVPNGVKRVTFDLFGAAGGPGCEAPGGLGGEATATFNVQAGQVFELVVGGGPTDVCSGNVAGGFNGGGRGGSAGGGGATDVRAGACTASMSCDLNGRILVAGGGGSGFIAPWAVFGTMQAGVQSGDGMVVISKA